MFIMDDTQINKSEDDILREPINNENKEESAKDIDYLLEKIIGPAGKSLINGFGILIDL